MMCPGVIAPALGAFSAEVSMNRAFWILIALDVSALAILLVIGLRTPSDSGGREMGIAFSVALPLVVVLGAALLYARSRSAGVRTLAFVIAAAPLLVLAVARGRGLLLDHAVAGARVSDFVDPDQRAVAAAILAGDAGRVRALAGRAPLDRPSASGSTLLVLALADSTERTLDLVRALLAAGADPNLPAERGWAWPLVRAISLRRADLVSALLEAGADPNRQNPGGTIAYHVALDSADAASLAILVLLLDHGARIDAVDGQQRTALMNAAIHGSWQAMALLLARGAGREARDRDGKTALDLLTARRDELASAHQPEDPMMNAVAEQLGRGR